MVLIPSRVVVESPSLSCSEEDDHSSHDNFESNSSPLRELCVPFLQNRPSSASSDSTIDSLTTSLKKLHIDTETPNSTKTTWDDNLKNQGRRRLTRPAITPNTFEVLETVLEDEPQRAPTSDPTTVSHNNQYHFKLPLSGMFSYNIY